jgi:phage-related minor tail protein
MGLPTGINGYAKGDVFNSADLSGYSNSIVKQPTFFAFASGGGVMGEAGPEAIMPLTRASDGSLGVRATNNNVSQGNTTTAAPQVNIYISDSGSTTTQSTPAYQQLGSNIAQYVQTQYQQLLRKDLNPGGAIWRAVKGQ